ncbi:MAG TPA: M14 family zinc carboxypeptidase [Gemmatimonadales bacterium]|nr:M14 family zinc carboxypeptidase [Gemmatimonadales bacterium]
MPTRSTFLALVLTAALGSTTASVMAQQPEVTSWQHRLRIAETHKVAALTTRRFTDDQFWSAVAPSLASPRLAVAEVGRSMQGRPLRTVTFGHGPTTVLLWSQMHGDEATATMALADIFAWLADSAPDPMRDRMGALLTVTFLPMLNPDGAEIFQRHNAAGIDINRDVRRLASPEARALKATRDRITPDFGFNLHDQSARTRVGNGEQAAIALLPPAEEATRSYGPVRSRARLVASWLATDFGNAVAGRIARYDDTFNPRAFGDAMQSWGTSTVLIESGSLPGDPQKQRLRTYNAAAIIGALDAIATRAYAQADTNAYESLPFNRGGAYDLLIRGGSLVVPGVGAVRADVAINFDDSVARTGGHISEVGDLETAVAMDTLDLTGKFLHPMPDAVTLTGGSAWVPIGAPARFIIRSGATASSPERGRIP